MQSIMSRLLIAVVIAVVAFGSGFLAAATYFSSADVIASLRSEVGKLREDNRIKTNAGSSNASLSRDLPEKPEWVKPVVTVDPKPGEATLVVAIRERTAKVQANRVINEFAAWYDSVRGDYAGTNP
jgi:hypothetical protein